MNDEPLMAAVVQLVLFLELSPPETLDEDAAVRALEDLAATLHTLGDAEKARFVAYVEQVAGNAETPPERECLRRMPEVLGLVPD
jgi:hypothetical protein